MNFFKKVMEGQTRKLLDEMECKLTILEKELELELTELEMLLIVLNHIVYSRFDYSDISQMCSYSGLNFVQSQYLDQSVYWCIKCQFSSSYSNVTVIGKTPEQTVFNCINLFTGFFLNRHSYSDQSDFVVNFREKMTSNKKIYARYT